jgi:hypothetical protein
MDDHIDEIANRITDDPDIYGKPDEYGRTPIVLKIKVYPGSQGRMSGAVGDEVFHRAISNTGEAGNILTMIGKAFHKSDLMRDLQQSSADEWLGSE